MKKEVCKKCNLPTFCSWFSEDCFFYIQRTRVREIQIERLTANGEEKLDWDCVKPPENCKYILEHLV